jgi:hypothetical protein
VTATDRKNRDLSPAAAPRGLSAKEVTFTVPAAALPFATTAEIAVEPGWVGQERALAALELGLGVPHAGYNIYVCGLGGTQREQTLATLLTELTHGFPRPGDRVLVQNFQNRDRPRAFYLPAGQGKELRHELQELVEDLKRALPETFRKETFEENATGTRARKSPRPCSSGPPRKALRCSHIRKAASSSSRSRMAARWRRRSCRS